MKLDAEDIKWIVTIPAIWSLHTKSMMHRALLKAELIHNDCLDHCDLVYEPECASLITISESQTKKQTSFEKGDKYMVVDIG